MNLQTFSRILTLAVMAAAPVAFAAVSEPSANGNSNLHAIGWQTFENFTPGNSNSGVADDTPDSNSTFDSTPTGLYAPVAGGGHFLTASIGPNASILGRKGMGESTDHGFLQGQTFGNASTPPGIQKVWP